MTKAKKILVDVDDLKLLFRIAESHYEDFRSDEELEAAALDIRRAEGLSMEGIRARRELNQDMERTRRLLSYVQGLRRRYLGNGSTNSESVMRETRRAKVKK